MRMNHVRGMAIKESSARASVHPSTHHPCARASVHPSTHPSIHPSIHLTMHPMHPPYVIYRAYWLHACVQQTPCVNPRSHQPSGWTCRTAEHKQRCVLVVLHPSIHPSMHPAIYPSIHPSIHPSLHPSIHPSMEVHGGAAAQAAA